MSRPATPARASGDGIQANVIHPARLAPAMLGRAATLLLLLAVAATGVEADAAARPFEGKASACHPLVFLGLGGVDPCPRVAHEGVLTPEGCDEGLCTLTVSVLTTANGLPQLRKDLTVDVLTSDLAEPIPLCAASGIDVSLACEGAQTVAFPLNDGSCAEIRVRSVFVELADVALTLPVRADNAVPLCRAADALALG